MPPRLSAASSEKSHTRTLASNLASSPVGPSALADTMTTPLIEPKDRYAFKIGMQFLWLTIFSGFFVRFEPAPYDLLILVMVVAFAATGLLRLPVGASTPLLILGVLALANVIGCFFASDYGFSLRFMAITFYLLLSSVFLMSLICEDCERVTKVIWSAYLTSAVCAAILAALGYYHLVPGLETVTQGAGRAFGTFKDPNVLSPFLVPPTIYFFSKFELGSGRRSVLALVCAMITLIAILLTFSRAAGGNLVVTFFVYLFLRLATAERGASTIRLLWCAALAVVVGTMIVTWLVMGTQAGQTFENKTQLIRFYDTHRFATQEKGLETILAWPFGVGPGMAKEALEMNLRTHSLYIQMFLEVGWLGGLAFVTLLAVTVVRSLVLVYRGLRDPGFFVAIAALMGQLLNGFVIDASHWRHFWMLLGIVLGQLLVASYQQETRPRPRYAAFQAAGSGERAAKA
jgi:O-antigen ligase